MAISESERRNLLHHYACMEPIIIVNSISYRVSVAYGTWYVVFYATDTRNQCVESMALVTMDTWNKTETGLTMACIYNCVLESLENGVMRGYEVGDVINLEL